MRYQIIHETRYDYAVPADLAHHAIRLGLRSPPGQRVLAWGLSISPEPAGRETMTDHFGNSVTFAMIDRPHISLEITMQAEVAVALPDVSGAGGPSVAELARRLDGAGFPAEPRISEFVHGSPLVPVSAAAAELAADLFPPDRPVLHGLRDLTTRIHRQFAYDPTATDVSTPISRVLRERRGVCQDFAHVQIAALRAHGLAASYVSGYLRTEPPPGQPRLRGADASHAWVGLWAGPEIGWVHADPTNDVLAVEDHIIIGWGRDFADVSPVRGVILGGGDHRLSVGVTVTPLDQQGGIAHGQG